MNLQEHHKEKNNTDLVDHDPLVSVVIATYNGAKTLVRAIEHVLQQTYTNYEIIVVDDGSTDDTRSVLDPFIARGDIAYYYQANAGCGAARNVGIRSARGTYIALLDADDFWHLEKLERQIDAFRKHPDIIVCYTESYIVDPYQKIIWDLVRTIRTQPRSGWIARYFIINNMVLPSSTLIPKDALLAVGGFCEQYDLMMVADLDMWLKLAPRGKFYACDIPLTFYQTRFRITQSQIKENHRQVREVFKRAMLHESWSVKGWYFLGYLKSWLLYLVQSITLVGIIKEKMVK